MIVAVGRIMRLTRDRIATNRVTQMKLRPLRQWPPAYIDDPSGLAFEASHIGTKRNHIHLRLYFNSKMILEHEARHVRTELNHILVYEIDRAAIYKVFLTLQERHRLIIKTELSFDSVSQIGIEGWSNVMRMSNPSALIKFELV